MKPELQSNLQKTTAHSSANTAQTATVSKGALHTDNRPQTASALQLKAALSKRAVQLKTKPPAQLKENQQAETQEQPVTPESTTHVPEQRTKAQMQEDVDAAKIAVQKVVSTSKTTRDAAEHFPAIQQQYKLKNIGFNASGGIDVEINPKATIHAGSLTDAGLHAGHMAQNVTFATTALGGSTVGKTMTATKLGANHPQGGPPTAAALRDVMGKLVTDPHQDGEDKYIKGHLLNDNIGGPGVGENLYPITASANKKHHDDVEKHVKKWVNDDKFWVYYKVDVTGESKVLNQGLGGNYVNATFDCTAYPLRLDGTPANQKIKRKIKSQKGTVRQTQIGNEAVDMAAQDPEKDANFDALTPEVSTSKKQLKDLAPDDDLTENLKWIFEEAPEEAQEAIGDIDGVGAATLKQLLGFLIKGENLPVRVINLLKKHEAEFYGKIAEVYHSIEEDDD